MSAPWNHELFIDGSGPTVGCGTIEVINPATEETIGIVPEASTKTPSCDRSRRARSTKARGRG